MAKTEPPKAPITAPPARAAAQPAAVSTSVRNSAVPKAAAPAPRKEVTFEMISRRAYEIHLSGKGGSEQDNWFRAERELRSGQ